MSFRWAEEGGHDTGWAEEVGPPTAEEVGLRMAEGGRATGHLLRAGPKRWLRQPKPVALRAGMMRWPRHLQAIAGGACPPARAVWPDARHMPLRPVAHRAGPKAPPWSEGTVSILNSVVRC